MKVFILLSLYLILIITNHPIHKQYMQSLENESGKIQFKKWHYIFNRPYDLNSEQALIKYKIFKKNVMIIKEHNSKNLSWKLGLGKFSDLTKEEFIKLVTNQDKVNREIPQNFQEDIINEAELLQDTKNKDWSYVFPKVKDQSLLKGCSGTCFAYSIAAIIEALNFLKFNENIDVSALELALCSDQESGGCSGGKERKVLEYIVDNGVSLDKDYPSIYETTEAEEFICKKNKRVPDVKIKNFTECAFEFNCRSFLYDSIRLGPVAAGIDFREFQHYASGIADFECNNISHSVVIVQVTDEYIKYRNHYGDDWGESGYGRVKRKKQNNLNSCGLEDEIYVAKDIVYIGHLNSNK